MGPAGYAVIDALEAQRLDDDLVIARALTAIGRWDEASERIAPGPDATGWVLASRRFARAQVLAAHPAHPQDVVAGLEAALDFFQTAGLPKPFLEGLGLAIRLHLLRRDDTVALDRAQRLARAADRLNDPAAAVAARLHAGLTYELLGDVAFADRVLREALAHATPGTPLFVLGTARRARVLARRGHRRAAAALIATLPETESAIEVEAARTTDPAELRRLADLAAASLSEDPALGPVLADLAGRLGTARPDNAATALRAAGHADLAALITREEQGAPAWVVDLHAIATGEALVAAGRLADAAKLADDVAPRLRARGFDAHATLAALLSARCHRLGGAHEAAGARLAAITEVEDPTLEALVALEAATQKAACGDPEAALTAATALAASEPRIADAAKVLVAECWLALGRPVAARAALAGAPPKGASLRARAASVELAAATALGEDTTQAAATWREAVAALTGLPREQAHLGVFATPETPEG